MPAKRLIRSIKQLKNCKVVIDAWHPINPTIDFTEDPWDTNAYLVCYSLNTCDVIATSNYWPDPQDKRLAKKFIKLFGWKITSVS